MPEIAELREIDCQVWARIPVDGDAGRIQILSDAEIKENDHKTQKWLDEIARLRAALTVARLFVRDDPIGHALTTGGKTLLQVIDEGLGSEQTPQEDKP